MNLCQKTELKKRFFAEKDGNLYAIWRENSFKYRVKLLGNAEELYPFNFEKEAVKMKLTRSYWDEAEEISTLTVKRQYNELPF